VFDVAVVGGGVVGCAVARHMSLAGASVVVIERNGDVGAGTSKANTAILHTGFDAVPGSVEARLVARGYHLLREYAPSVGISTEETGAVLVAWDDEQSAALDGIQHKAIANGYRATEVIDAVEVLSLEPHLGAGVRAGMLVPGEFLIDPWSTPIAFAREAIALGARFELGFAVDSVTIGSEVTTLCDVAGRHLTARFVVNAAGLHGDTLHQRFGFEGFTIRPRRGELIVFDKLSRPLLNRIILPVPTAHTKGVLVAPTVFGNVMLGPTAEDIDDRADTRSTRQGLDDLLMKGRRILPDLLSHEVTAVYAGLRAATEHTDYQLSAHAEARYICLGGIRSTGLTASMALAEEALTMLQAIGLGQGQSLESPPEPVAQTSGVRMTPLGEATRRPYQDGGRIVCHCERVTEAEVTAACGGDLPATDIDGLRRRTRALAGRCQGFYCLAEIIALCGWDPSR
jgi:glycerol-3-phosphate dehydrogenase